MIIDVAGVYRENDSYQYISTCNLQYYSTTVLFAYSYCPLLAIILYEYKLAQRATFGVQ